MSTAPKGYGAAGMGLLIADHRIPPGFYVVELKQCEGCVALFARRAQSGILYCAKCRGRALMPDPSTATFAAALPTEGEMKHSNHLPRYDDSLLPKEHRRVYTTQPKPAPARRAYRSYGNYVERLRLVIAKRGPMSLEDMQEIVGCPGGPSHVNALLRGQGILLRRCGNAPRRSPNGPPPGLFDFGETIQ